MARRDPHSYADDSQVATDHVDLVARVDFATKTIAAEATLTFAQPGAGTLDLDTRDLAIESVASDGKPIPFTLHPVEPVLGARLSIELPAGTRAITIRYRTSPAASALQWLDPTQTSSGKHPFLYSQCQAIHARSIIPLQDTPRLRIRYRAELHVPKHLVAVMAAAHRGRIEEGDTAIESFEMPQPIPPYLFAFAIGELVSRDLSDRSRVWAEPAWLDRAAYEYANVDKMMATAEALYGPYDWDRFDILLMPPSFPYGGMENPRLTFITPTTIAGDRSLVDVISHELAHSWTGNLVTNANAEHFWLNEGFTVFAERRITQALEGTEMYSLHEALGRRELDAAIARLSPELTLLRTHLAGIDPDDAYSQVPYEKGYFFLRLLEDTVTREKFDAWLKVYLRDFRFAAITTDDFVAHFERAFPGVLTQVHAEGWIDGPGLPLTAPRPASRRLEAIEALGGALPPEELAQQWSATEWQIYLDTVPRPAAHCAELDERYHLTSSGNHDILCPWLVLALESGHHAVVPRVEEVLESVGRMKYLRPLYAALSQVSTARARELYERVGQKYHPISRRLVERVLRQTAA